MQNQTNPADADGRGRPSDAELADVLTAISVVAKRLARKLSALSERVEAAEEGGARDEQNQASS